MQSLGIKSRVILLAVLPAVLFTVILAGYTVVKVCTALDTSFYARGHSMATQLAPAAMGAVVTHNLPALQSLTQEMLTVEPELNAVVIADAFGEVLALSGKPIATTLLSQMVVNHKEVLKQEDGLLFLSPIKRHDVAVKGVEAASDAVVGYTYVELSNFALQTLEYNLVYNIAIIGLMGLLLSTIVAWLIGRNITQPIQAVAFAVDRVAEGDFSHALKEDSGGELKTLQTGFNAMAKRLKYSYTDMQTQVELATERLRYQAQHDDLTGLMNRREFEVQLSACLDSVVVQKEQHVLCYLDLDQFKLVNDSFGHVAGDALLKEIGQLFLDNLTQGQMLARLGGDEFGLLLRNTSLADANSMVDQLLKLTRDYRYTHEGRSFNVGVSVGMVALDASFTTTSELIHAADTACYSAKYAGRNQSFLYNHGDIEHTQWHQEMSAMSAMTNDIDDNRFTLYCQPIVQLLADGNAQPHYEVLIRHVGEDGEITLPMLFIPSAERYNLMPKIDRWVIKNTFAAYRKMLNVNSKNNQYRFSINLSGTSLGDMSFLTYIQEQFAIYAIPPQAICFEITETAAVVNFEQTTKLLSELGALGCQFALDDFGSGMSSFKYLKKFAVDYLKIDGSFVRGVHQNTVDHATVQSIHTVAQALNIKTVAEYVENDAILNALKKIGVTYGQGNHLGEPVALDDLIDHLSQVES